MFKYACCWIKYPTRRLGRGSVRADKLFNSTVILVDVVIIVVVVQVFVDGRQRVDVGEHRSQPQRVLRAYAANGRRHRSENGVLRSLLLTTSTIQHETHCARAHHAQDDHTHRYGRHDYYCV